MTPADRDRVRRLILARCPELGPADLALIGTIHPARPSAANASRDIMGVLEAMESKLDRLVEAIGDGDVDDLAG